jgi:hypothetical protein
MNMTEAMADFYALVTSVTGQQPDTYNAKKGVFEKHLDAGESISDESETPKSFKVVEGEVKVSYAGQKRTMRTGDSVTIAEHTRSLFTAVSPSTLCYSYAI